MINPILLAASFLLPVASASLSAGQCDALVKSVVAFGASVTQATPAMIPGFGAMVTWVELYERLRGSKSLVPGSSARGQTYESRPYGLSPVRYVVKYFGGKTALNRITYVGTYFTRSDSDLGSSQMNEMLEGSRRELFATASLVMGIDGLYWDAIFGNCDYGRGGGAESTIRTFVREAQRREIAVVLGTVPLENTANVRIDSERIGIPGLWYAPVPACVESINRTLHEICRPEAGCYLADLAAMVDELASGRKLSLRNGKSYGLYELRPDGVHLSDVGTRYVAELVERAIEAHPPTVRR